MEQLEFFDVGSGALVRSRAIELAPGVHELLDPNLVPPDALPRYGICEFVRSPDGTFKAIARTHGALVKLTKNIATELGIRSRGDNSAGIYKTIQRLYWSGFIRGKRLSHDCYYIDLHSLFAFLRKVEKPGFWNPERIATYLESRDGPLPDASE